MPVAVDIDLRQLAGIRQRLDAITEPALKQLALERAGAWMLKSTSDTFQASGRPVKWEALSPVTIANRRAGGRDARPLMDTGRLAASVSPQRGQDSVYRLTPDALEIGTARQFAHVHQFGATIHPRQSEYLSVPFGGRRLRLREVRIPARPFLQFLPSDVSAIERILQRTLEGTLAGPGDFPMGAN